MRAAKHTVAHVARETGIKRPTLTNYLSGKFPFPFDALIAIASLYKTTAAELIKGLDVKNLTAWDDSGATNLDQEDVFSDEEGESAPYKARSVRNRVEQIDRIDGIDRDLTQRYFDICKATYQLPVEARPARVDITSMKSSVKETLIVYFSGAEPRVLSAAEHETPEN